MALEKKPLHALQHFLPPGTFELVNPFLQQYHIRLKITKQRRTKYGDYRLKNHQHHQHQISVNGNLNPYHFLLTLVHEIAHLVAFDNYGFQIKSHGTEWKSTYKELMRPFLNEAVFPPDLLKAVTASMNNIKSSSCYDADLVLALRQYDETPMGTLIKDLEPGSFFKTPQNKNYQLLEKRRTRYEARELATEKIYLFPALYEVEKL